jgi:hypothetical protein
LAGHPVLVGLARGLAAAAAVIVMLLARDQRQARQVERAVALARELAEPEQLEDEEAAAIEEPLDEPPPAPPAPPLKLPKQAPPLVSAGGARPDDG